MGDKDSPPGSSKDAPPGTSDPVDATLPKPMLSEKDVESIAELMLKKFKERSAEPKDKGLKLYTHHISHALQATHTHTQSDQGIALVTGAPIAEKIVRV